MDQVTLSIEYSPILRDNLRITKNGQEVPKDTGAWQKVFNKLTTEDGKCNFLQEVGASFFDALYEACYGKIQGETLIIDMQTTEEVFKDFEKMTDWYSKNNPQKNKIVVSQLTKKLASNDIIAKNIEDIACNLKEYLNKQIKELKHLNKKVLLEIEHGIKNIDNSLSMTSGDNEISVCVTGVFSSGKSTFINALLGDDILESKDEASTAAIYSIKKIKENEKKKAIKFNVISPEPENICLQWEENKLKPATKIANQIIINELLPKLTEDKTLSEQFQSVGTYINEKIQASANQENNDAIVQIDPNVTIDYPFSLGGNIPVKICDTPGTNSSFKDDGEIIQKALSNQKNSILITLLDPCKSDDRAGNNILFNTINEAEKDNAYLDKSRIFFIWNKIDGASSKKESILSKKEKVIEIEEEGKKENIKTIKVNDFPLFFMSSQRALCAQKLIQNPSNTESLDDYSDYNVRTNLSRECSLGWQTESLHSKAEKALEVAGDDEYKQALVMSGLYSVQNGITDYINKYASAIIANGRYRVIGDIIDDLNSLLAYERASQCAARDNAHEKFQNTKSELEQYVKDTCNSLLIENNESENDKELADLNNRINSKIIDLSKNLNGFHLKKTNESNLRNARVKLIDFVNEIIEQQNKKIEDSINVTFQTVTNKLQEKIENSLPVNVWIEIKKDVYKEIEINNHFEIPKLDETQFLWLHRLNKDDFNDKATQNIKVQTASVRNSIINFNETINAILEKIKNSYIKNLEEYSQTLVRYKNNEKAEKEKLEKLEQLCNTVSQYKNDIDGLIFK